jgi:acyl carrier protein
VQVFQRELWTAYDSLQLGKEFSFAPLALQYGDFSVWQRDAVDSEVMKGHLDFWLKTLSGDLPVLNFPTDHAPSYQRTSLGAVETLLLPDDLSRSLKQLAQSSDVTLFVVTLACFALVLARASDAQDLVVGSPVVNRRIETEPLIGPFAGPVALRLNLSDDPTLRDFILTARDTTLEALGHAELPFEVLLERLKVWPTAGRSPLFQFYFFCQPAFFQSRELPELTITPFPSMSVGTPFEMQLGVIERKEGVRAELEYNANLFEKSTVEEWLAYYQMVLSSLVSNPDQRVSDLPMPPRRALQSSASYQLAESTHESDRRSYLSTTDSSDQVRFEKFVGPRDAIEVALTNIWERMLDVRPIGVTSTFFSLGGHSLMLLRLLKLINKEFGVNLEITRLFQAPTIEQLANVIREVSGYEDWSSLVPINIQGSKKPLFLVHSYMLYGRLPRALGEDQPFYGLKQPPLGKYVTPDWVDHMLQDHIKQIRFVQPEGPYQIAGWCFAGLMAYEIARRLEESGSEVSMLALLDSWCPYHPVSSSIPAPAVGGEWNSSISAEPGVYVPKARLRSLLRTASFHVHRFLETEGGQRVNYAYMTLRENFLGFMIRSTREFKGVAYRFFSRYGIPKPPMLRDVTLVTYEWIRHYRPKRYKGDIVLFRPEEVPVPPDADPNCGWGCMTTGKVRSVFVPGNRRSMFLDPNVFVLATRLRAFLSER